MSGAEYDLARLLDAANDDRRELRARAEKAEAEVERMHRFVAVQNAWANDFREQRDALRDGIQALADEWGDTQAHSHATGMLWAEPAIAALRGLLSPTPEGPTP